jgi:hypothetical protein
MTATADRDTRVLQRRARMLAWLTIGYNTAEGVVAVVAGLVASSAALAWQFGGGDP